MWVVAALLLVAALLGTACADDVSRERDYREDLVAAFDAADESAPTAPDLDPATTPPAEWTAQLRERSEGTSALVADVRSLEPPEDLEDEHDSLVAALEDVAVAYETLAVVDRSDGTAVLSASQDVLDAVEEAEAAYAELARA